MKKLLLAIALLVSVGANAQISSTIAYIRALNNTQITTATGFHAATHDKVGHIIDTTLATMLAAVVTPSDLQSVLSAGNQANGLLGTNSIILSDNAGCITGNCNELQTTQVILKTNSFTGAQLFGGFGGFAPYLELNSGTSSTNFVHFDGTGSGTVGDVAGKHILLGGAGGTLILYKGGVMMAELAVTGGVNNGGELQLKDQSTANVLKLQPYALSGNISDTVKTDGNVVVDNFTNGVNMRKNIFLGNSSIRHIELNKTNDGSVRGEDNLGITSYILYQTGGYGTLGLADGSNNFIGEFGVHSGALSANQFYDIPDRSGPLSVSGDGTNPTFVVNAGAGSGASATLSTNADDIDGVIRLAAGTGASAGDLITVTFNTAFNGKNPETTLTAHTDQASGTPIWCVTTTAGFVVKLGTGGSLTPGGSYQWSYHVGH